MRITIASIFIVFGLISGCSPGPGVQEETADPQFRTTDPSRLYFRNMRSYYYDQEALGNSRVEVYRLRRIPTRTDSPLLFPLIANDWLNDRAYLLTDTTVCPQGYALPLTIVRNADTLQLADLRFQEQCTFLTTLHSWLDEDAPIYLLDRSGTPALLFSNPTHRQHFLMVMRDFNRLREF